MLENGSFHIAGGYLTYGKSKETETNEQSKIADKRQDPHRHCRVRYRMEVAIKSFLRHTSHRYWAGAKASLAADGRRS